MGVHVLDVLARPVDVIPEGQGGELVEEIRMTAAGSAGGTALVLAKLGAEVRSAGAVGGDAIGDMLIFLLRRAGVDPSLLIRRDDVQTSASVLPIRPNGDRPAFHVIGANGTYGAGDAPLDAIAESTHLHLGGPEFMGGEDAASVLAHARAHGVTTSADVLAPGDPGLLEWIAPALPELDYLLPNEEQALGFTGAADLEEACRALVARGVGCVAATRGAQGALVVDADERGGGARVRGRRGGHHRLWRRLLGRFPARACTWRRPRRGGAHGLRRGSARGPGSRHRLRAVHARRGARDVRGATMT